MMRNKSVLVVLVFTLCLSFGLLCSAADYSRKRDPRQRYEDCQRQCQRETLGEREQDRCEEKCASRFREEQQQQEDEEQGGSRHSRHDSNPEDPQSRYQECQRKCQQKEQSRQPQCEKRCQRQLRYEQESEQEREEAQRQRQLYECQKRCQQQEEQRPERLQQCETQCMEEKYEEPNSVVRRSGEQREGRQSHNNNPYYFPRRQSFEAQFVEEHGSFRVLQRFSENSPLLKGINEFRLAILEANPNAFVLPHHCDAEKIYIVTNGKGTLTFVTQENKESFHLVRGVVVRVPAGSTVYLVNQDNNEKLTIAVLHRPVNNPGHFEAFFPAGPQNPDQSYYRTFSQEIIQTVLNTRREQLDRLFQGKQSQQGLFRRASQEQIRSLSQEATSPKQKGGERFAFNLLTQSPKYSNQNGRLYEACPREFELLRNISVSVSASQINQGSIFVPHYNSEATFVVLVTEGNGYVEMVCPHLSSQSSHRHQREEEEREEEETRRGAYRKRQSSPRHHEREEEEREEEETRSGAYRKITARLSAGDIFVVPAGHPVTWVASQNNNLRLIGFGLNNQNNQNNQRIFIAGKNNNVRQWDSEAKELSFGVPARLVDEVFNNPQESYFVSGSQHQRQRGSEEGSQGNNPLSSILDFARLF